MQAFPWQRACRAQRPCAAQLQYMETSGEAAHGRQAREHRNGKERLYVNANANHEDAQPDEPARKFALGQLLITRSAAERLPVVAITMALRRHAACDWGDVDQHDWASNEAALQDGARLLSAYHCGDIKFWIITEADRSVTTVLLPEDY